MEYRPDSSDSSSSGSAIYIVALVIALAIVGAGVYLAIEQKTWAVLAAGAASVVAVLVTWPLAMQVHSNRPEPVRPPERQSTEVADRLKEIVVLLNVISEQQLLSDRAKSVAFREKDREALRRAIKEDLARRDWEAALVLVNDMERTFGYAHEAVTFRQEINAHRDEVFRRDVAETTTKVENLCRQEKWTEALREAERVITLFPNSEEAQRLPADIEMRRQNVKKQLVDSWNEAIAEKRLTPRSRSSKSSTSTSPAPKPRGSRKRSAASSAKK